MTLPFEMIGRKVVVDGVELILRHGGCDKETRFLVKDTADLSTPTPMECACGFGVAFYYSDAALGRRLLELVKLPNARDRFGSASGPSQN